MNTHLFVDSFLYTIDTKLDVMLQVTVDQHNEIKLFCFSNLWTAELMKCCLVSTVPLRSRRYQRTDLTNLWPSTLTMESPLTGGEASRFRAKPRLCTPSMLKIPGTYRQIISIGGNINFSEAFSFFVCKICKKYIYCADKILKSLCLHLESLLHRDKCPFDLWMQKVLL